MEKIVINKEFLSGYKTLSIGFENCDDYKIDVADIVDVYCEVERIDGGRTQYYTDCFREYVTNCYFQIVLTEPKSGVSTSFNVVIDPNAVTGVTVANSEMFF